MLLALLSDGTLSFFKLLTNILVNSEATFLPAFPILFPIKSNKAGGSNVSNSSINSTTNFSSSSVGALDTECDSSGGGVACGVCAGVCGCGDGDWCGV